MDTIFINSGNSKISNLYILLKNLSDKTNLKRSDKHVVLLNININYTWKNIEKVMQK